MDFLGSQGNQFDELVDHDGVTVGTELLLGTLNDKPTYIIANNNKRIKVESTERVQILQDTITGANGLHVTGPIETTGTVDGVDVATRDMDLTAAEEEIVGLVALSGDTVYWNYFSSGNPSDLATGEPKNMSWGNNNFTRHASTNSSFTYGEDALFNVNVTTNTGNRLFLGFAELTGATQPAFPASNAELGDAMAVGTYAFVIFPDNGEIRLDSDNVTAVYATIFASSSAGLGLWTIYVRGDTVYIFVNGVYSVQFSMIAWYGAGIAGPPAKTFTFVAGDSNPVGSTHDFTITPTSVPDLEQTVLKLQADGAVQDFKINGTLDTQDTKINGAIDIVEMPYGEVYGTVIHVHPLNATPGVYTAPSLVCDFKGNNFTHAALDYTRMTYTGTIKRIYHVACSWALSLNAGVNKNIKLAIYHSTQGILANSVLRQTLRSTTEVQIGAHHCICTLNNGEYIELRIAQLDAATAVDIYNFNLFLMATAKIETVNYPVA